MNHEIGKFTHLMKRADLKNAEKMLAEEKEAAEAAAAAEPFVEKDYGDTDKAIIEEPIAETCTIDDFGKVDMRVARVVRAEHMKEAKKLLKLTVSFGGDDRSAGARRRDSRARHARNGAASESAPTRDSIGGSSQPALGGRLGPLWHGRARARTLGRGGVRLPPG